jgi:ABC-2 type transport system permease protein
MTAPTPTSTAAPGGRSADARPLRWRAEARRQLGRRRTQVVVFALIAVLPLLLVGAFSLGADDGNPNAPGFVDLATRSGANFSVFTLFATTGFALVVIVALFFGDTVPSEASWGSLRYLLIAPVPRGVLLRSKLVVAAASSLVALVIVIGWSTLVGFVFYGTGPFMTPGGDEIGWSSFLPRILLILGYTAVSLLTVAALAFLFGVLADAPLAAVGGAVLVTILSTILDSITALGHWRFGLPTHYSYAWADALGGSVQYGDMLRGSLWSIGYAVILMTIAFVRFSRKDILS